MYILDLRAFILKNNRYIIAFDKYRVGEFLFAYSYLHDNGYLELIHSEENREIILWL